MKPTLVAVFLILSPAAAHAGGFQVYEHGAVATGQVGAFTAQANDPSAIFYNAAGLADQRGLNVLLNATITSGAPEASGLPEGDHDAGFQIIPVPSAYMSYGIRPGLTAGLGAFAQYGLAVDWGDTWSGRFLITDAKLQTLTINPSLAWRPLPWLAVGAGFDITPARVKLVRALDLVAAEGQAAFEGNAVGYGANAGLMVNLPVASLGLSYRSQYDLEFDDGVIRMDVPAELASVLSDSPATTTLAMPDVASVGVRARPLGGVRFQAQLDWINWSRFEELSLVASEMPEMTTTIPQRWNDGYTLRLGGEAPVGRRTTVRAGAGYDWAPVPRETLSPIVPDSDRYLVSAGASSPLAGGIIADLAVMGVIFRPRQSALEELPVEYRNWAVLTGITLRYGR